MAALQKFKDLGWHLSEDGVKRLSDDGQITDFRELEKRALDTDLREISNGGPLNTDHFKPAKLDIANQAGIVLQVLAVRNVSAPKSNEESKTAPRMLLLDFTDGKHECRALEIDTVPALSVNTAPGAKVLLRGTVKVSHGHLMLVPANVQALGGQVQVLYESWEHKRALAKYAKGTRPAAGPNGPPPWIQFGQRSSAQQQQLSKEKGFKSLAGTGEKDGDDAKENAEFAAMRAEAIAKAMRVKTKKTFGGGGRNMVDYNVKKICDKGFTEEEAKLALKYARNNLERAMGNLKKDRAMQSGVVSAGDSSGYAGRNGHSAGEEMGRAGGGRGGRGDRRGGRGEMDTDDGAKPPTKPVSLFDFLTEKIPQVVPDTTPVHTFASSTMSSSSRPSFSANRPSSSSHHNNNNSNHHQHNNGSYSHRDEHNNYPSSKKHEENPFRKPTFAAPSVKPQQQQQQQQPPQQQQRSGTEKTPRSQSHGHIERPPKNDVRSTIVNSGNSSNTTTTSKTSAVPSTASSKNPFSLENRAKFQNNVSTSFANRKTTSAVAAPVTQPATQKSSITTQQLPTIVAASTTTNSTDANRNQRGSAAQSRKPDATASDPKATAGSGRGGTGGGTGNAAVASVSEQRGNRKASTAPNESASYNAAAKYQQNAAKLSKGGLHAVGTNQSAVREKQQASAAQRNDNPFSKSNNNDRRTTTAPTSNTNSKQTLPHSAQIAELTKATAAIKIETAPKSARSTGNKTVAGKPAAAAPTTAVSANKIASSSLNDVLPNGFNPNKIMGFANKETNEVALNVLRANALAPQGPAVAAVVTSGQGSVPEPFAQAPVPTNRRGGPKSQLQQPLSQKPQQHVQKQQPLSSQQQQQTHTVIQHQPPYAQQQQPYSIIQPTPPAQQQQQQQPPQQQLHMFGFQSFNRPLNIKDVCFAKYWEDGGFYNAEITGVSECTCVVEFLEYGNFEEVLLSDCVPITEMNIQLVNQYNASLCYNAMQTVPTPATAQQHGAPAIAAQQQLQQSQSVPIQQIIGVAQAQPQQQQQYYGSANVAHQQPLLQTPVHQHQQPQHFNPTAIHYGGGGAPMQQPSQPFHHNQQQQQQQQQRLRGERQMYVPPAQRSTK